MSKFDKVSHAGGTRFYSMPYLCAGPEGVAHMHGCFKFSKEGTGEAAFYVPQGAGLEAREVPDGLLGDLLGVDPYDADELEAFMGRYGLAYSLARVDTRSGEQLYYDPPSALDQTADQYMTRPAFRDFFNVREREGVEASVKAFGSMFAGGGRPSSRFANLVVSGLEAREAVAAVRGVCAEILEATKEGRYPSAGDHDAFERLNMACGYASAALSRYTFAIAPVGGPLPSSAPALALAIGEAVRIALDGEPLKQCKHCGRWFQYKTGARTYAVQDPSVQRRERRADYCSVKCQQAHNYEKLKAKRAAERAEREKAASNEKTAS